MDKDFLYWHGKSVQELSKKEMKEALEWAFKEIRIERELHKKTRDMAGLTLGDVLSESVAEKVPFSGGQCDKCGYDWGA